MEQKFARQIKIPMFGKRIRCFPNQMIEAYTPQEEKDLYDNLFIKYYRFVFAKTFFLLKDRQEAEDLVQNFFTDLWESRHFLTLKNDIKGYLYTAIKNRALNYLRDRETDRKRLENIVVVLDMNTENRDNSYTHDYLPKIKKALEELPKQQKNALQMVYLQAKRYQEAADVMGISINSLKSHLKVGLKNIRIRIK